MKKKYTIPTLCTVELGAESLMTTIASGGVNNKKPTTDSEDNLFSDASAWDSSNWSDADED